MIDLPTVRALIERAREDTSDGLDARERLVSVAEQMADEIVTARTVRIVPSSLEPVIDPAVHTPARLRTYLTARGWVLDSQYPEASHWRHDTKIRRGWDAEDSLVLVLDSTRFSDYARRMAETVVDMAGFECVGELQVLADIEAASDA